jgi:hypothetical protein
LTEFPRTDLSPGAREALGSLPETIVHVDQDFRLHSVNHPKKPVFRRAATEGDLIQDLFEEEAAMVVKALIDNAQIIGDAIAEHDTGSDLFRVTAKRMSSVPHTLLVFRNITGMVSGSPESVVADRSGGVSLLCRVRL